MSTIAPLMGVEQDINRSVEIEKRRMADSDIGCHPMSYAAPAPPSRNARVRQYDLLVWGADMRRREFLGVLAVRRLAAARGARAAAGAHAAGWDILFV